jgi:hypothetical protein
MRFGLETQGAAMGQENLASQIDVWLASAHPNAQPQSIGTQLFANPKHDADEVCQTMSSSQ